MQKPVSPYYQDFQYNEANRNAFNMNISYLVKISQLMDVYILSSYADDFDTMFETLDLLATLLSPKFRADLDHVTGGIAWIEENKEKCFVKDETGHTIRINYENKKVVKKQFRVVFVAILQHMEKEGILTKLKSDPNKAMANMTA